MEKGHLVAPETQSWGNGMKKDRRHGRLVEVVWGRKGP